MVESKAEANVLYRGFVIKVSATKESSGRKMVHTHIRYHVPELKPELAERVEKREIVETDQGEIECMRTYDTIGPIETDRLTCGKYYRPSDEEDEKSLIDYIPLLENDDTTPKALSTLVRESLEETQSNIDAYIANHSTVEINKQEFRHGLEQSLAEPMSEVKISTPEMNSDSEFDKARPEPERISRQLSD